MTTRDDILKLFTQLSHEGFKAGYNAACCNTCASYELGEEAAPGQPVAFTHQQNESSFAEDGRLVDTLHIGYFKNDDAAAYEDEVAVGERVALAALKLGLTVQWDGDASKKVAILPSLIGEEG